MNQYFGSQSAASPKMHAHTHNYMRTHTHAHRKRNFLLYLYSIFRFSSSFIVTNLFHIFLLEKTNEKQRSETFKGVFIMSLN